MLPDIFEVIIKSLVQFKKTKTFDTAKTLGSALCFVLVIHSLLIKPFIIPSPSMYPELMVGDYLFVSKFDYGYSRYSFPFSPPVFEGRKMAKEPKRGEVVVFRPEHDRDTDWIKRVVGLPGDRIQMRRGVLYINQESVGMDKIGEETWKDEYSRAHNSEIWEETLPNGLKHKIYKSVPFGEGKKDDTREFIVPEGHYFMMGDNRDFSGDSRFSRPGFVPFENLVGQAQIIFFSTDLVTEGGSWWMFWRWPLSLRLMRTLKIIR